MTSRQKTKSKPIKKVCEICNLSKVLNDYYNADTMFFPSGKMHICKDCTLEIVNENGHEGLLGLLRIINKPFYQNLFKGDVRDYVRMVNSMMQYKNVGFTDSDSLVALTDISNIAKKIKPTKLTIQEFQDAEDFWGEGYTETDFIWLSSEFAEFGSQYDISGKAMENLIREICLTQLDIRKKRAAGKDVKNELKTYQDLLGSSNLKPMQETGAQSIEQETFGTLIKKFEETRPIPDEEQWKSSDKVGKYLSVWFTGHLMRMLGLENKNEQEYYDELNKYTVTTEDAESDDENDEGDSNGWI